MTSCTVILLTKYLLATFSIIVSQMMYPSFRSYQGTAANQSYFVSNCFSYRSIAFPNDATIVYIIYNINNMLWCYLGDFCSAEGRIIRQIYMGNDGNIWDEVNKMSWDKIMGWCDDITSHLMINSGKIKLPLTGNKSTKNRICNRSYPA